MTFKTTLAAGLTAALFITPVLSTHALAEEMKMPMQGHAAHGQTASTKGFEEANAKMHKDMMIKYSGKTDADFVRSMIPHHQGAIDMAKVELAHGTDPAIRKIAEDVIKAQEAEIKVMQDWLAKNGK
ncbi:CopM family metallochaperone [Rhizobium oryzicola]|uniref:DUF305 domain-containing protein n=1 Tax=Rhizobium oryzicola TaxID=1232668 RepID=A0ABT8SRX8_9HYPH|nr:DUF305 domain-containing protein [Rhizobium oryzicola]MDO1581157.1 DUF305 domain-containing protein [Rhizobium oryzicola]